MQTSREVFDKWWATDASDSEVAIADAVMMELGATSEADVKAHALMAWQAAYRPVPTREDLIALLSRTVWRDADAADAILALFGENDEPALGVKEVDDA